MERKGTSWNNLYWVHFLKAPGFVYTATYVMQEKVIQGYEKKNKSGGEPHFFPRCKSQNKLIFQKKA